ncbi:MAG: hypothetical protein P9E24_01895 [Candidatus Competibacter sp.]|nr:hypothetical protein [Candidatus Competibacter sp.]MDG4585513.1 hypothetical protein [Candidatus Competibacter sp.]
MRKSLFVIVALNAFLSTNQVFADDVDAFVEACLSSSNIDRPICECTAQKAKRELSPKGFDFVIATLRRDDRVTAKLRTEMTIQEMTQAGTFMTRGPAQCAKGS